jgi:hypothetical protein
MAITSTLVTNTNTLLIAPTGTTPSTTFSGSQIGLAVTSMMFCNYTPSTTATVTVYAVPSGQSVGNTHMIVNALSIPGGETVSLDQEKLVLGSGDSIIAIASVNSVITSSISTLPV